MKLFRHSLTGALAIAALLGSQVVSAAPRSWMLPSEVQFTGSGDEWLTVDAALSTDLYYYDHPGQAWEPKAFAPDGSEVAVDNLFRGKLRFTFDLHITQPGTYKVAIVNDTVMGSYMLDGERKTLPRGTTPATLAAAIPAGATDVQTAENNMRLEIFASAGEPTLGVFKPTGKGIEMVPVTHPNDLIVGEPATFQFLLDGKPAAGLVVTAVNGGVRYRDGLGQLDYVTGADGKVTLEWPEAGMWWVNASLAREEAAGGPGAEGPPQRRASYAMTVEVLG